jgi:hypothetical protein
VFGLIPNASAISLSLCPPARSRRTSASRRVSSSRNPPARSLEPAKTLKRRLELGDEYFAVARATVSADLLADAYHWQALNHLECGQLDELEALLEPV